ncbi:hypothetical protein [Thalassotalea piscium]|uniref:hypothetical protein n=1 Tax=Thalassotalea piscium TaxID=1230533 RepID=UPI001619BE77|nr:hypothetical protein [Thalassotalea piscium]
MDKGIDHLAKLTCKNDNHYYTPIRIIEQTAISFYVDDKKDKTTWVSIDKKRTINASIKALIKAYPLVLNNGPHSIYTLNEDDQKHRKANRLIKRKWKIHEVARWADGFFVARLSCSGTKGELDHNSQFVLYPALFQDYKPSVSESNRNIYTKHGQWNNVVKVNMHRLEIAFKSDSVWDSLGEILQNVEYGYDTENEAKVGFEYVVGKQDTQPTRVITTGKRNAKRQSGIDKTLPIKIIDHYYCHREEAWLFHSNERYYIMRMDAQSPGIIKLLNKGVSTGFINEEQSARQLLTNLTSKNQTISDSDSKYDACVEAWQEMIKRDVYQRYFITALSANWQIVEVAMLKGAPIAVKAICLPEVSNVLPVQFNTLPYRLLRIEDINEVEKVNEPVRSNDLPWYPKSSVKEFQSTLLSFLDDDTKESRKAVIDVLVYTCGTLKSKKINEAFNSTKHDKIIRIDGDACPLPLTHNKSRISFLYQQQRERLIERIERGALNKEQLVTFDEHVTNSQIFSKHLVDFGLSRGLLIQKHATEINTYLNKFRDDISVDLIHNVFKEALSPEDNQVAQYQNNADSQNNSIKSTKISNAGRKRIYKNDKERKRLWAREHRKKLKAKLLKSGIEPNKPGPTKVYKSAAEKQAAYRFRKKWEKKAKNSALLVFINNDNLLSDKCIDSVELLLPYYRTNSAGCGILFISTYKEKISISPLGLDLYKHDSSIQLSAAADYINVIDTVKNMKAIEVHFAGVCLSEQAKTLATLFKSDGISTSIINHCVCN